MAMNKLIEIIFLAFFIGLIGSISISLFLNHFDSESIITASDRSLPDNSALAIKNDQFNNIEEMHWTHMPITFTLNKTACGELSTDALLLGFKILENVTENLIQFREVKKTDNPDIEVLCIIRDRKRIKEINDEITRQESKYTLCKQIMVTGGFNIYSEFLNKSTQKLINFSKIKGYDNGTNFYNLCHIDRKYIESLINELDIIYKDPSILGEAVTTSVSNLILSGKLYIFEAESGWISCTNFPVKEIHEILHTFGFGHRPWNYTIFSNVMSPYVKCSFQKYLDVDILSCLKKIYSNNKIKGECLNVNIYPYNYEYNPPNIPEIIFDID